MVGPPRYLFRAIQVSAAPPAPRGTMLKGNEWIRSCKINAHICFECPAHRLSTLYKGGRGGAPETWNAEKENLANGPGVCVPSRQDERLFCKDRYHTLCIAPSSPPEEDETDAYGVLKGGGAGIAKLVGNRALGEVEGRVRHALHFRC